MPEPGPKSLDLLVVEDDEGDYLLLSKMCLKFQGLKVRLQRAQDFDSGMEHLRQSRFDVALVDYRLDARNGLEFIASARSLGSRCPMILLTGVAGANVDMAALQGGAADYLDKSNLDARILERSLRYAVERQAGQDTLLRSEQYYRGIIDNSQDLITITDEQGLIQFESASIEAILGYGPRESYGKEWLSYVHPEDRREAGARHEQAIKRHRSQTEGEQRMLHKDGSWRHLEIKAKNLLQLSGLKGLLFNARDVTERKRSVDTLLKVERLAFLGQMTAGMAHEVRNPVAIIGMNVEMLRDGADTTVAGRLDSINEQCARLLRLIEETLNFSKNRSEEPELLDARAVVDRALKLARIQYGSAEQKVQVSFEDEGGVKLYVDRHHLELVLINLVLNAYQAMHDGGSLTLGIKAIGDGSLITVSDSGPGISESELLRIFDPFYTTKQQGSGLGLWLCQRMVDGFHGRMSVQSVKGKGASISVWVPNHGGA